MIVSNTSAADFPALLDALYTFLTGNGWTGSHTAGATTATLVNSNGHTFNVTSSTTARTDFFTGAFTDRDILVSFDRTIVGGAPGASATARSNDFQGPFPNIWFFTDDAATFCHIVTQSSASRYSHMSFGDLDNKGIHAEALPFAAGMWWQYWCDQANYSNSNGDGNPFNNPSSNQHSPDYLNGGDSTNGGPIIGIPDGVLDPTLFFTDGPLVSASVLRLSDREYSKTTGGNNSAYFLDYLCNVNNGGYTGGVILSPMPAVTNSASQDVRAFIGEYPSVALVNMQGLSPGQTITFADDEWLVFPLKQFGTTEAAKFGSNPLPQPNSWRYGYAYRSVIG